MTTAQMRQLQSDLGAQGFVVNARNWPRKATYYKPDGEEMPNLPADPNSMERYLARGFTLTKSVAAQASMQVTVEAPIAERNLLECVCGFTAKSTFGLSAHQRKHVKEKS